MDLIKEIIQIIPSRDIRKFYKTALPTWSKQQMITIIHNFADYADCVRLYKAVRQGCRDEILLDYIDRTLALLEAEGHRNDPKIEGEYRSLPSYSVCNPPVLFGIGDEVQYYRFVAGKEQTELTIGKVTKLPPSRRESFFDEFYEVKTEENTVENVSVFEVEKRSRTYCLKSVVQECRKNGIDRYFCVGSNNQERTFTYRQGDYRIHDGQTQKVISTKTQLLFKAAHDRFMEEAASAINGNDGFISSTVLNTKIAYKKGERISYSGAAIWASYLETDDDTFDVTARTTYEPASGSIAAESGDTGEIVARFKAYAGDIYESKLTYTVRTDPSDPTGESLIVDFTGGEAPKNLLSDLSNLDDWSQNRPDHFVTTFINHSNVCEFSGHSPHCGTYWDVTVDNPYNLPLRFTWLDQVQNCTPFDIPITINGAEHSVHVPGTLSVYVEASDTVTIHAVPDRVPDSQGSFSVSGISLRRADSESWKGR